MNAAISTRRMQEEVGGRRNVVDDVAVLVIEEGGA